MISRIKELKPSSDYRLLVTFDDDVEVSYNVADDIRTLPDFKPLLSETGLFENVRLDESRTCVYWSDRIDLASDTIREYGIPVR